MKDMDDETRNWLRDRYNDTVGDAFFLGGMVGMVLGFGIGLLLLVAKMRGVF